MIHQTAKINLFCLLKHLTENVTKSLLERIFVDNLTRQDFLVLLKEQLRTFLQESEMSADSVIIENACRWLNLNLPEWGREHLSSPVAITQLVKYVTVNFEMATEAIDLLKLWLCGDSDEANLGGSLPLPMK